MEPNSIPLIKPEKQPAPVLQMAQKSQTFDLGPIQAHMGEREFVISQLKQTIAKLQAELAAMRETNQSTASDSPVKS